MMAFFVIFGLRKPFFSVELCEMQIYILFIKNILAIDKQLCYHIL